MIYHIRLKHIYKAYLQAGRSHAVPCCAQKALSRSQNSVNLLNHLEANKTPAHMHTVEQTRYHENIGFMKDTCFRKLTYSDVIGSIEESLVGVCFSNFEILFGVNLRARPELGLLD